MSRPHRIEGFAYRGPFAYFLTFCVKSRRRVFLNQRCARETIELFCSTANRERFAVIAYCLMPDHAHLLVQGLSDDANLRRFAKLAKQRSGAAFAMRHRRPLWQEGYFERVLRKEDDLKTIVSYVLANPVRAGLVASPAEYPYSGSDRWTMAELFDVIR